MNLQGVGEGAEARDSLLPISKPGPGGPGFRVTIRGHQTFCSFSLQSDLRDSPTTNHPNMRAGRWETSLRKLDPFWSESLPMGGGE